MNTDNTFATRSELIVASAFASLDFSNIKTEADLDKALNRRIDTLYRCLSPKSVFMRRQDAVRIPATITNIEFEDNCQRFLITYTPDKSQEGWDAEEHVHSDRLDGFKGNTVRAMWESVSVGDHVDIYKILEETGNPKKPQVRIGVYVRKSAAPQR